MTLPSDRFRKLLGRGSHRARDRIMGTFRVAVVSVLMLVASTHAGFASEAKSSRAADQAPPKFCLFSWGLSDAEKLYVSRLIIERDSSRESRSFIWNEMKKFCIGAHEFQAISSCISFSQDLRDCLMYFRVE